MTLINMTTVHTSFIAYAKLSLFISQVNVHVSEEVQVLKQKNVYKSFEEIKDTIIALYEARYGK